MQRSTDATELTRQEPGVECELASDHSTSWTHMLALTTMISQKRLIASWRLISPPARCEVRRRVSDADRANVVLAQAVICSRDQALPERGAHGHMSVLQAKAFGEYQVRHDRIHVDDDEHEEERHDDWLRIGPEGRRHALQALIHPVKVE
eukprot:6856316-Prymnesium_polylepis.2